MKRNHSETIADFIKYIDEAKVAFDIAQKGLHEQEAIECDILHKMELGCTYEERCRLATKLTACLKERRYYKDIIDQTQPVMEWLNDGRNAAAFNQIKQMLGKVRKSEKYMETRTYRPRTDKVVW